MRNFMTKIWGDKRGNALIIAAAALPLLIGSAGLATDTIQWALWKRQLQRAADSAAIAGVYDRVAAASATTGTAAAVTKDLSLNNHTGVALQSGYPIVSFPANAGINQNQVRVQLAVQRPLSFSAMFMTNPPLIRTTAQAATVSSAGEFCVLSLQNNSKTGIQATGSATIVMDCGMMTNSTSTNAAAGQGSSSVTATVLAAAGGIQQSSNWTVDAYQPYSPALASGGIGRGRIGHHAAIHDDGCATRRLNPGLAVILQAEYAEFARARHRRGLGRGPDQRRVGHEHRTE